MTDDNPKPFEWKWHDRRYLVNAVAPIAQWEQQQAMVKRARAVMVRHPFLTPRGALHFIEMRQDAGFEDMPAGG